MYDESNQFDQKELKERRNLVSGEVNHKTEKMINNFKKTLGNLKLAAKDGSDDSGDEEDDLDDIDFDGDSEDEEDEDGMGDEEDLGSEEYEEEGEEEDELSENDV